MSRIKGHFFELYSEHYFQKRKEENKEEGKRNQSCPFDLKIMLKANSIDT